MSFRSLLLFLSLLTAVACPPAEEAEPSEPSWRVTFDELAQPPVLGPRHFNFGTSLSMDRTGASLLIGTRGFSDEPVKPGAVFVLQDKLPTDDEADWEETGRFTVPPTEANGGGVNFGREVTITADGLFAFVGHNLEEQPRAEETLQRTGGVLAYQRTPKAVEGEWSPLSTVFDPDGIRGDTAAGVIAVSDDGEVLVFNCRTNPNGGFRGSILDSEALCIFRRDAGRWLKEATLVPDLARLDEAQAVAVSGDGRTAVLAGVGFSFGGEPEIPTGARYVAIFRNASAPGEDAVWQQEHSMNVPHVLIQAPLPVFLSEDGGVLVVGSNKSEVEGVDDAGAVVVVRRDDAGVWVLSEAVHAPSPTVDGNFGDAMALSRDGRLLVVAAMAEEDRGALYLFLDTGTGFVFSQRVVAPDRRGEGPVEFLAQDAFGQSIAISDDGAVLAVGAPRKDQGRNVSAGAVYVYRGLGLVR